MRTARAMHWLGLAAIAVAVGVSCSDPVHDDQVHALGPENPQIPKGEYHRSGQPCTVCHGPEGPAQTQFSVAGTIYNAPYAPAAGTPQGTGMDNATVAFVDDLGQQFSVATNCVGNFWATPAAYNPSFPILVTVYPAGSKGGVPMITQISRAGSCAQCHNDPPNYNAVGHVYSGGPPPTTAQQQACPVPPDVSQLGVGGLP